MKLDKETFVKHQFWFFLGIFLPVWIIALSIFKFNTEVAKKQKKYDDDKKAIAGVTSPKNESFNRPWEKYGKVFHDNKEVVWKQAWELQNPPGDRSQWLFTWPDAQGEKSVFNTALYPQNEIPRQDLSRYKNNLYATQFEDNIYAKFAAPVELADGVITPVELAIVLTA